VSARGAVRKILQRGHKVTKHGTAQATQLKTVRFESSFEEKMVRTDVTEGRTAGE